MSTIKLLALSLISVCMLTTSCGDTEPSSKQPDSGITIHQKVGPVLIGRERNPVLQVQLQGEGKLVNIDDPVSSLKITTEGTTEIEDIASVDVFYAGEEGSLEEAVHFGGTDDIGEIMEITGKQELMEGSNWIWGVYEMKEEGTLV